MNMPEYSPLEKLMPLRAEREKKEVNVEAISVEEVLAEEALQWGDEQAKLNSDAVGILAHQVPTAALAVRNPDGAILGAVTMSPGRVIGLYVTPEERKRGIGFALLSEAVRRLAADGKRVIIDRPNASGEMVVWKLPEELLKSVVIRDND